MKKFTGFLASAWRRCKAYAFAFLAAFGFCTVAHAEGAADGYDITVVNEVATKLKDTLETFWTSNKASILAILGIIVILTLIWLVVKLFKKSTNKAA